MKRKAFTMMELMMAIVIIALTSLVVIVSVNKVSGQSAKREADKLAHWLVTRMSIADSTKRPFLLKIQQQKPVIFWDNNEADPQNKKTFDENTKCTFSMNIEKLEYAPIRNDFSPGGTITVTGKEGPTAPYYVILNAIGARVRVSDTAP